ncbi:SDR family NAD(P)-dependent oxidoreductase [Paenibacillus rhizovicinus]|uniref:SDR family NAD(P)-dependent oxidoreductase n=1 Tax=Paenibacillus rhizovicinus TaxID=2704463 RepID=A0A6C0P7U8_9BACL|nr:SDR family NAD(P)-dependent oxidoreductase [Paenibacillus rhizovicinus]QHW34657.1 SDR family NAD(P)-dependent oxidoreductase [Paenibacillus rhizovicinus]
MNIVITGASRGLGFELAIAAAKRGHHIIAGVRDKAAAEPRFAKLEASLQGQIELFELDVTSEASARQLADELQQRDVTVDALVNNAAILLGRDDKIESLQFGDIAESFETNLFGPIKMVQALMPLLRKASMPSIMNISSEAGAYATVYAGDYPYGLSKSALTYFSEKLRKELEPQGFQVLAIHPGWIRTDMGGERAPGDPVETAEQLVKLLERVRPLRLKNHGYVDPAGRELQI